MSLNDQRIVFLKKQRTNAKRQLSSYETFLSKLNTDTDIILLKKRYLDAETIRENFDKAQTEIEALTDNDNDDDSEKQRSEFDEKYFATYRTATEFLETHSRATSALANGAPTPTSPLHFENSRQVQSVPSDLSDLPKVNLPIFDSCYDSWQGFYDLFNSFINADDRIPNVRKLVYLRGCLTGDAADLIASIPLSAENYQVAWNTLKDRYNKPNIIRQTHIRAILALPHVSKDFAVRALLDGLKKRLRALEVLEEPVQQWDSILIEILKEKFNDFLRERWEDYTNDSQRPTMAQMITFLDHRARLDEVRTQSNYRAKLSSDKRPKPQTRTNHHPLQAHAALTSKANCMHCNGEHNVTQCKNFIGLSAKERYAKIRKVGACLNCLKKTHLVTSCPSSNCRICDHRHHTLLHFAKEIDADNAAQKTKEHTPSPSFPNSTVSLHAQVDPEAVLATAVIEISSKQGVAKPCRVFLDAGSQANFITEEMARALDLKGRSVNICVSGIEAISTNIRKSVSAVIKSRINKFQRKLEFLVVPRITGPLPAIPINRSLISLPKNIPLADPEFHRPSKVDALIGVQLFYQLLCIGKIELKNQPDVVIQKTLLGWIVAGNLRSQLLSSNNDTCGHLSTHCNPPDTNLSRFWELEEISGQNILSPEERACEEHFKAHTSRNSQGRYVVRLPFNEKKALLGESFSTAIKRFRSLEHRFSRNSELKKQYIEFLDEYQELNHMSNSLKGNETSMGLYLPHHAVLKEDSITTKIRVVFDGSAKTSTGVALNETLMVGPKIQDDLFTILVRFRGHVYALTADIEKMYRQVLVHPDDCQYQKILFRNNAGQPIESFTLNTVTYGTSCASFLAVRALRQLAEDESNEFPIAAAIVKRDFYVDDLLTGASTHGEAAALRDDLLALLARGGFSLRKWASNDSTLVAEQHENPNSTHMALDPETAVKTLGIQWNSREDSIFYTVKVPCSSKAVTKRTILSQVAKLFDPLGLLGPVIVQAKIIIQKLWKAGVTWDESVPVDIYNSWIAYRDQLPLVENVRFNRCITLPNCVHIQIHGFCDASESAYGACIYARSIDNNGKIVVRLICAKSRVAPVKSVSVPRLELCGALLLSRLLKAVRHSLHSNFHRIYLWSDSTIVLHWIKTEPHLLKTFVANRIAEIQEVTKNCHWRHVRSEYNPADAVSRGQTPSEFMQNTIWVHGPSWLSVQEEMWPREEVIPEVIPELKDQLKGNTCMKIEISRQDLLQKYSSISKLKRVIAYMFRFVNNCTPAKKKFSGSLQESELDNALHIVLKLMQSSSFGRDIDSLRKGGELPANSRLTPLSPFLDSRGILRVGGRISKSELPEGYKHPILLPPDHYITKLMIREEHVRLKHAGVQTTVYSIREKYWPINARNVARKVIHKCITCFRAKPREHNYLMGDLPRERVTPGRPFLNVGIDYCGPFFIKEKRHRNRGKIKAYVAVYICLSTKAIHLELVSDLTTAAFISSLKRFFARRGKSKVIYSDNATNFVGASRELHDTHNLIHSSDHNKEVEGYLNDEQIIWRFIPPRSPHFGGLWEAAVKSFKHHFLRTIGDTLFTYEQLETFVVEIEAILNSRPLSPMSSDPNDLQPLTPGHFLVGGPLISFPQMDFSETPVNRLTAWQHAQQMRQHFWKRWQKEYLHQLNRRNKWQTAPCNPMNIGTLVLMKEDNTPPMQWPAGRIIATHPGADNIVRVVTIRTSKGEYKRSVKNLYPLPVNELVASQSPSTPTKKKSA